MREAFLNTVLSLALPLLKRQLRKLGLRQLELRQRQPDPCNMSKVIERN